MIRVPAGLDDPPAVYTFASQKINAHRSECLLVPVVVTIVAADIVISIVAAAVPIAVVVADIVVSVVMSAVEISVEITYVAEAVVRPTVEVSVEIANVVIAAVVVAHVVVPTVVVPHIVPPGVVRADVAVRETGERPASVARTGPVGCRGGDSGRDGQHRGRKQQGFHGVMSLPRLEGRRPLPSKAEGRGRRASSAVVAGLKNCRCRCCCR